MKTTKADVGARGLLDRLPTLPSKPWLTQRTGGPLDYTGRLRLGHTYGTRLSVGRRRTVQTPQKSGGRIGRVVVINSSYRTSVYRSKAIMSALCKAQMSALASRKAAARRRRDARGVAQDERQ